MPSTRRTIRELMQGIARARRAAERATACCPATWVRRRSARRCSTRWRRCAAANPEARYCCDPVIGDVGRGVFVQPGVAEFMRDKAVPAADIVTPNHFELDHLTGRTTATLAGRAGRGRTPLRALGPRIVLVTSLRHRRHAGRRDRSARLRRPRPLPPAHPEAADLGQRRGRRHRGAVLRALPAHRLGGRGAVARGVVGVRHPPAHRGRRLARNPADRGAGRTGQAEPRVPGAVRLT